MAQQEEDIEIQLQTYKEQFQTIEQALRQDTDNESLLKLKSDLIDVINLTEDLLKLKRNPVKDIAKERESKEISISSSPNISKRVLGGNIITSMASSPNNNNNNISNQFSVGSKCRARFSEDGLWYDAIIESVPTNVEEKYFITFNEYGNQAYVGQDELLASVNEDTSINPKKRKEKKDLEEDSGIVIPKSLKILPTDSEEERQAKKKRIHIIKSQTRLKKREEERSTKKNAWQEFSSKPGGTKISNTRKDSIFRSPDSVEGKVGVTGSGKPLTPSPQFKATEVTHVKHKIAPP